LKRIGRFSEKNRASHCGIGWWHPSMSPRWICCMKKSRVCFEKNVQSISQWCASMQLSMHFITKQWSISCRIHPGRVDATTWWYNQLCVAVECEMIVWGQAVLHNTLHASHHPYPWKITIASSVLAAINDIKAELPKEYRNLYYWDGREMDLNMKRVLQHFVYLPHHHICQSNHIHILEIKLESALSRFISLVL